MGKLERKRPPGKPKPTRGLRVKILLNLLKPSGNFTYHQV
jgi:hypothetical protein